MYSGSNGTFDNEYIRYVLDAYSVMIVKLCFSYVKNMHDAEDMAQEAFCELIKRKPAFESSEHEKAWLIRTAVNKCKNHLKSGWVRKTVPLEDGLAVTDEAQESTPNGESSPGEENNRVLSAVMSLPVKYRTVIHMYYYIGLSISEIAEVKKVSSSTVGTQLARGRELLRKKLGGDFDV